MRVVAPACSVQALALMAWLMTLRATAVGGTNTGVPQQPSRGGPGHSAQANVRRGVR